MYYKHKGEYFKIFNDGKIIAVAFFPSLVIKVHYEPTIYKHIKEGCEISTQEEFESQLELFFKQIKELK